MNLGSVLTFNTANSNAISVSDPDAGSSPVSVTLTATNGTIDLASQTGLTVTDAGGDASTAFTGPIASINAALEGLTFTPSAVGPATLQIVTNDQGNTGDGGAQSDTDTVDITVASAGTTEFNAATYTVNENAGVATITLTRSNTSGVASVDWSVAAGGTATAGTGDTPGDFIDDGGGTVTFADGQSTATFDIAISDDLLDEPDETINLALANPGGDDGIAVGDQATATLTITDDDPTPTLRVTDVATVEGSAASTLTFTALLELRRCPDCHRQLRHRRRHGDARHRLHHAAGILTFAPARRTRRSM